MTGTEPPMHPDFVRWIGEIDIGSDAARQETRWRGVNDLARVADSKDIDALLRLAFKTRQLPAAASTQKFREVFKAADTDFQMQGNDRELQLLAAATLVAIMNAEGRLGAQVALSVSAASLGGARKPQLPMNLGVLGESVIGYLSGKTRTRADLTVQPLTVDLHNAVTKAKAEYGADPLQAFGLVADSVNAAFSQIARRNTEALQTINGLLRVQDEELQMLWWLMGQRSTGLDCAFVDIPELARPLVFAKELSDVTASMPGPLSVKAILSRAGLTDKETIALSAIINAADDAWLLKCIPEGELSFVATPLHFGIRRRMETGAGSAWVAGWAATAGIAGDFQMTPLAIGLQFYREQLLLLFGDM